MTTTTWVAVGGIVGGVIGLALGVGGIIFFDWLTWRSIRRRIYP